MALILLGVLFLVGLGLAIGWIIWSPPKLDVAEVKIVEEDSRLTEPDRLTRWLLNL